MNKPVIGMIHLLPLPMSPRFTGDASVILTAALRDADALVEGGVHGLMLENFGDVPFYPDRVPVHVVARISVIASEIRRRLPAVPLGVNVLRNDGRSALAVASACGAQFIRVNVLCGARVADQGVLQSIAHDLMRERALLGPHIRVLADVDVKHSSPLAPVRLEHEVDDTLHRGLADALIVSGSGTGKTTDLNHVRRVKAAAGNAPVLVGSGVTADNIADYAPHADGFIVGTSFKEAGDPRQPVSVQRVRDLMRRIV